MGNYDIKPTDGLNFHKICFTIIRQKRIFSFFLELYVNIKIQNSFTFLFNVGHQRLEYIHTWYFEKDGKKS